MRRTRRANQGVSANAREPDLNNRTELPDPDPYVSLQNLARYSGLSVRTLRKALRDPLHPLPHYRPGGRKVLVRLSEFNRWMTRFRREGPNVDRLVSDLIREVRP